MKILITDKKIFLYGLVLNANGKDSMIEIQNKGQKIEVRNCTFINYPGFWKTIWLWLRFKKPIYDGTAIKMNTKSPTASGEK